MKDNSLKDSNVVEEWIYKKEIVDEGVQCKAKLVAQDFSQK